MSRKDSRLRVVAIGSLRSGKSRIVRSLLDDDAASRICCDCVKNETSSRQYCCVRYQDRDREKRIVETRFLSYHETFLHLCHNRYNNYGGDENSFNDENGFSLNGFVKIDKWRIMQEGLSRDSRYIDIARKWLFVPHSGRCNSGRSGDYCTSRIDALVSYEFYDTSLHLWSNDPRRLAQHSLEADVLLVVYDPRDEESIQCALQTLGSITVAERNDDDSTRPFSIVLIEHDGRCGVHSRGDCDEHHYSNPNAVRSLRNYFDCIEPITCDRNIAVRYHQLSSPVGGTSSRRNGVILTRDMCVLSSRLKFGGCNRFFLKIPTVDESRYLLKKMLSVALEPIILARYRIDCVNNGESENQTGSNDRYRNVVTICHGEVQVPSSLQRITSERHRDIDTQASGIAIVEPRKLSSIAKLWNRVSTLFNSSFNVSTV